MLMYMLMNMYVIALLKFSVYVRIEYRFESVILHVQCLIMRALVHERVNHCIIVYTCTVTLLARSLSLRTFEQ